MSSPHVALTVRFGFAVLYVEDLDRMVEFYSGLLGLPIAEHSARFVAFVGAGAPLALEVGGPPASGPRGRECNPTLFQFTVNNLAVAIECLAVHGVGIEGDVRVARSARWRSFGIQRGTASAYSSRRA